MRTQEHSSADSGAVGGDELLTTGDMARLSESTLRTVRFYEEEGLIQPVARPEGGHRHFRVRELRKLELALHLREAGLSIADIKQLFGLKTESASPKAATQGMTQMLQGQVGDLDRKITKLERLRSELSDMVSTIADCENCSPKDFPQRCQRCEIVDGPGPSRAVDVLWR
ncbi:MAG: MerR family transcriptional regulator [Deltaproteobacteria bacterium]|nr:MerR family transcriptional regulator [Deltaproteobacteria bacterium]